MVRVRRSGLGIALGLGVLAAVSGGCESQDRGCGPTIEIGGRSVVTDAAFDDAACGTICEFDGRPTHSAILRCAPSMTLDAGGTVVACEYGTTCAPR